MKLQIVPIPPVFEGSAHEAKYLLIFTVPAQLMHPAVKFPGREQYAGCAGVLYVSDEQPFEVKTESDNTCAQVIEIEDAWGGESWDTIVTLRIPGVIAEAGL